MLDECKDSDKIHSLERSHLTRVGTVVPSGMSLFNTDFLSTSSTGKLNMGYRQSVFRITCLGNQLSATLQSDLNSKVLYAVNWYWSIEKFHFPDTIMSGGYSIKNLGQFGHPPHLTPAPATPHPINIEFLSKIYP